MDSLNLEITMDKFRCRECPVQEQCINQSDTSSGAKSMIRNAFAARTDTLSTWAVLQKTCLLVREAEERKQREKEGSLLGRLVRKARATEKQTLAATEAEGEPDQQVETITWSPEPIMIGTSDLASTTPDAPVEIQLTRDLRAKPNDTLRTRSFDPAPSELQSTASRPGSHWLIVSVSHRRIALPANSDLILGRFDPDISDPLDVDLTFEDQTTLTVSRRHARIVGTNGHHTIEDLHSSNGLYINGTRVKPGDPQRLGSGDYLALGGLQLAYEPVSTDYWDALSTKQVQLRHFLHLTHTGRRVEITPPYDFTIGRSDPATDNLPSLDMSQYGDIATYISRRHAVITWQNVQPTLSDLQSTFGTRLNGEVLPPNQSVGLKPGDHMSLGGCVLAYDVELPT
jgi:pSer/pThr/pTyr-binding forkhead associated (FHA) protein